MSRIGELLVVAGLFLLAWHEEGFGSAWLELRTFMKERTTP